MNQPTLSVLLPNFNNAPYLRECLNSLYNQTFQDFVIYFVDDCSTDDSIEIALSYPQNKMIILRKDKNSGIVDTLNLGLDQITSKYFIRMDGDDRSHLERFEKMVGYMEAHSDVAVCTSNIETFGIELEKICFSTDPLVNKANLIFSNPVGHPSSIFRTNVLKKNGVRYQNDFWRMEDYQLFYSMKNFAKYTCLPEFLYFYRRGSYNLNDEIRDRKIAVFKKFYKMIFDELGFSHNEIDLNLHAELGGASIPSHRIAQYEAHINRLLSSNLNSNIFPQKELEDRLKASLHKICFVSVELGNMSLLDVYRMRKAKGLLRYYLSTKIRKKSR
jgi:glycosyltransferase involved in cell wall biosynthesis